MSVPERMTHMAEETLDSWQSEAASSVNYLAKHANGATDILGGAGVLTGVACLAEGHSVLGICFVVGGVVMNRMKVDDRIIASAEIRHNEIVRDNRGKI